MLPSHSTAVPTDFLRSFCCLCCFSSKAYTSKTASGRSLILSALTFSRKYSSHVQGHNLQLHCLGNPQNIALINHLSFSFMVKGQQSTLPAVTPSFLPLAHCTPEVTTAADCIQPVSFCLKALAHLTDQQ